MKHNWLKIAVGLKALPPNPQELYEFVEYADREHILAQVAYSHSMHKEDISSIKPVCADADALVIKFDNAWIRAAYDQRMLMFESDRVERALAHYNIQPTLLKGGAYVIAGHRAGQGRRVSDLDIMVADGELSQVEKALIMAGWQGDETVDNDYDQAYYRKWMHELPPMRHQRRRTLIDVHHRLTPKTARIELAHEKMIEAAVKIEGRQIRVLAPTDRFLHAAYHAFYDGELDTPARSLIEIYYLFDDLTQKEIIHLLARARDIGAEKPLFMALQILAEYFDHSKANDLLKAFALLTGVQIPLSSKVIFWLVKTQMSSNAFSSMAKLFLYIRGHWMRMPFFMLLKHLSMKAFRKPTKQLPKNFLENDLFG